MIINRADIDTDIESACEHYEKSAPMVSDWLDSLYRRIGDKVLRHGVLLSELRFVDSLREGGEFIAPNIAANELYHLRDMLGQDQTGICSY
jgi:hypothetical protein